MIALERPTEDARRPIRCCDMLPANALDCRQVLGRETCGGDFVPIGEWRIDVDGRPTTTCPACGRRKRLPVRKVA